MTRRAELAANLADLRTRIARACDEAGRDVADVTLIAVTKTFPADDIRLLAELGVHDIGENRAPDLAAKREAIEADVRWHFVGQIQRNKAQRIAASADVVHAVDRVELVTALDRHATRRLTALVQVALDATPGRGGAEPDEARVIADAIEASTSLDLGGVMAIAPLGADPDRAFARLAEVAARIRADHPDARMISAGMSGDLEAAIRHGATHVRVGTALLGPRASLVG